MIGVIPLGRGSLERAGIIRGRPAKELAGFKISRVAVAICFWELCGLRPPTPHPHPHPSKENKPT